MNIALDVRPIGRYRGDCECGFTWTGHAVVDISKVASPALPLAEAVVHHRMCHDNQMIQLVFSYQFELWLEQYWVHCSATTGLAKGRMTR